MIKTAIENRQNLIQEICSEAIRSNQKKMDMTIAKMKAVFSGEIKDVWNVVKSFAI